MACSRTLHNDSAGGKARTRNPLISSLTLYVYQDIILYEFNSSPNQSVDLSGYSELSYMLFELSWRGCTEYSKTYLNGHSQKDYKFVFKTNYPLMQVKSIAECSKGSIQYFRPWLSFHFPLRSFFLFLHGRFTQVYCMPVSMSIFQPIYAQNNFPPLSIRRIDSQCNGCGVHSNIESLHFIRKQCRTWSDVRRLVWFCTVCRCPIQGLWA